MTDNRRMMLLLVGCLVLGVFCWFSVFNLHSGPNGTPVSSTYKDSLSGTTVDKDSINNNASVYPISPYFIGFDALQQESIPDSDTEQRYVQDFVATYVMEHTDKKPAAVSFVKDSLHGPDFNSKNYETTYSFQFGINGGDIHNVSVRYNPIAPTINIVISQAGKSVAQKTLTVYYSY